MVVTRYDLFRDFDRLTERMMNAATEMRAMPVDLYRTGDHFVLRCDLPGADPGSIDVGVDGRVLTIRAQRSATEGDVEWMTQERPTGTYVRQLTLGNGLDLEHIEATYADGVLTLTLPVAEAAKPRRIEIKQGESRVALGEGGSVRGEARTQTVTQEGKPA